MSQSSQRYQEKEKNPNDFPGVFVRSTIAKSSCVDNARSAVSKAYTFPLENPSNRVSTMRDSDMPKDGEDSPN